MMAVAPVVRTKGVNWQSLSIIIGSITTGAVAILAYIHDVKKKVGEVHILVNNRLDNALIRIDTLTTEINGLIEENRKLNNALRNKGT